MSQVSAAAVETLALAFGEDPMAVWMQPDAARRPGMLRWFSGGTARLGARYGLVETLDGGRAVAVWLAPGQTTITARMGLATGWLAAPFGLGLTAFRRFGQMAGPLEDLHQRLAPWPHWYLLMLGVHPAVQGRGLGRQLVEAGMERARREGAGVYLETIPEENIRFYEKRGLRIGGSVMIPRSPLTFTALLREP